MLKDRLRGALLIAVAWSGALLGAPTPPRWVQSVEDSAPVQLATGSPWKDASSYWAKKADGSAFLLVPVAGEPGLAIHAFDAAGQPAGVARLPEAGNEQGAGASWFNTASGDPWLHVYGSSSRALLKLGANGTVASRVDLPPRISLHLLPLDDGGLLTSTPIETARMDASGTYLWRRSFVYGVDYIQSASATGDGDSWAALTTNDGTYRHRLLHLGRDGAELGRYDFPCTYCAWAYPPALLALPDGGAAVVTDSDSVTRVSPGGEVLWTRYVGGAIREILAGPGDRISVKIADGRIRTIHLPSASLSWTNEARWFFASPSGATAVQNPEGLRLLVQRLSAEGRVLAEQSVDLADMGFDFFQTPRLAGDGEIELVAGSSIAKPQPDGCFANPVVLRITAGQGTRPLARVCATPRSVSVSAFESSRNGVLVHTSFGLAGYARDGRLRWRYEPSPQCRLVRYSTLCPYIRNAVASPDGGAWLLESDAEEEFRTDKADRIVRIAPDGSTQSFPMPSMPHFDGDDVVLLGGDHDVRLLWTDPNHGWGSVGHLLFALDGTSSFFESKVADFALPVLASVQQQEDGDITFAYRPWGWVSCLPQPCDNPVWIVQSDAWGKIVSRAISPWSDTRLIALGSDGSAWLGTDSTPAQLQRFDARGDASAVVSPLRERGGDTLLYAASETSVLQLGWTGAHRINSLGQSEASTAWDDVGIGGAAISARGLLLNRYDGGLTLRSIADFSVLADFQFDPPADRNWSTQYIASADDGGHFAVRTVHSRDGTARTELARFDEPGSQAAMRLFSDGLEP
jgi:hypothetical protein